MDGESNESEDLRSLFGRPPQYSRLPDPDTWKPNEEHLDSLVQMGIDSVVAKKALYYTNNLSTESAIEWIFNQDDSIDKITPLEVELEHQRTRGDRLNDAGPSSRAAIDSYKMVFVVNAQLTMGVGKIAAQVAHATLGLHKILLQHQTKHGVSLLSWSEDGETKIVLRGDTTEHLIALEHKAISKGLPCFLVHDAGKTQVQAGATTVLAIFGSIGDVDQVTGELKLY